MGVRLFGGSIHALLHFTVAPIASLNSVGGRRQERIIQEHQGFFEVRREQFLKGAADRLETSHSTPQLDQLGQGRVGAATSVEQTIDFVHDLSQGGEPGQASGDAMQRFLLSGRQAMLHEQVTVIEEISDPFLDAFPSPYGFSRGPGRPSPSQFGQAGGQGFANLGYCPQNSLGQFRDGVELADLVRDVAKHFGDRSRIKLGTIRGDARQDPSPVVKDGLEAPEELPDVIVTRIMVENLVKNSLEGVIVHDGKNALPSFGRSGHGTGALSLGSACVLDRRQRLLASG
jgi:hypothetical protein